IENGFVSTGGLCHGFCRSGFPARHVSASRSKSGWKPDLLFGIFGSFYVFDKFDSQTQRETMARRGSGGRFAEKKELATDQHGCGGKFSTCPQAMGILPEEASAS
ncbi:MAG TPA: hypothetical protein VGX70_01740, partial [Gemmataceae bacterium]|nr:hypothetical protein [Gemmataceae bacterium]